MLSWLKRRAKVTINNRYINLFRSNINTDMFVSEPVSLINNDQTVKLTVFNTEGHAYPLELSSITTVGTVKVMAVGHFFGHGEHVGSHPEDRTVGLKDSKGSRTRTYRLVVLRGARPLSDESPLHFEKLVDNDVLLLVERRDTPPQRQEATEENSTPTLAQIASVTAQIPKRNEYRDPDPAHTTTDFQTEFRRILVTMIEASVRLISADPDSKEVFNQILDKLERRHRPKVDRNALRQLTEMGFSEAKATKALQVKRNFNEAVEWLLDDNFEDSEIRIGDDMRSLGADAGIDKGNTEDRMEDPAKKILHQFLQYRRKWFQPNPQALQSLRILEFPEERIIEALRVTANNENAAREILVDEKVIARDDQGLERDSPIISAILASPVIQLALPKPKTLLALMMLFESPNNANMWLSDPDTHPVVSQVLRIYHAEKHSLNHNHNAAPASKHPAQPPAVTSGDYHNTFPSTGTLPRSNASSGTVYPMRSESHPPPAYSSDSNYILRNTGNGIIGNDHPEMHLTANSPLPMRRLSPSALPVPPSRGDTFPNPSLVQGHPAQTNIEEPMSHSGSPIREIGTGAGFRTSSMANGGPPAITRSPCAFPSTDIVMDEASQDSQDMET